MDYCSVVWHSIGTTLSQSIESVQNYAMRVFLDKPPHTPSAPLREFLGWHTLHQRRHRAMLSQVHRCILNHAPSYLCSKFQRNSTRYSSTRGANKLHLSRPSTEFYRASFEFQGAFHYNKLDQTITSKPNLAAFKAALSDLI